MRLLIVAPQPPRRCGVGMYAAAEAARLRAGGHEVTVLSPPGEDGEIHARLIGGAAFRLAARVGRAYDRVVIHFQPALYLPPRAPLGKVLTAASLLWLTLRRRHVELVVHEADPPVLWRPDYLLLALAFRSAGTVRLHTRAEWRALEDRYRVRVRGIVAEHREGVRLADRATRSEARGRLEIASDGPVFLCAGFLHPDKGFERAIRAFAGVGGGALHVVGSVREATPANLAYASRLRELCRATPGVALHERFQSDRDFDAWVRAADAVVLPYRRSWSSGLLARAQLNGTPAIVMAVGGLPEQAGEEDVVVADEEGLAEAMRRLASEVVARRSAP